MGSLGNVVLAGMKPDVGCIGFTRLFTSWQLVEEGRLGIIVSFLRQRHGHPSRRLRKHLMPRTIVILVNWHVMIGRAIPIVVVVRTNSHAADIQVGASHKRG